MCEDLSFGKILEATTALFSSKNFRHISSNLDKAFELILKSLREPKILPDIIPERLSSRKCCKTVAFAIEGISIASPLI